MHFALIVNNETAMKGDASSIAIIFNNLVGVNQPFGDGSPEGLAQYRRAMGRELFSNEDAFCDGTVITVIALPDRTLATYRIGDPTPARITSNQIGEAPGGFAKLHEKYPEPIASKYSAQDPIDSHNSSVDSRRYCGPIIKTRVRSLGVQHFAVYAEPRGELLQEFKSSEGRKAFDDAVLLAEQRGLPWRVAGGAEVFEPIKGQVWSL